MKPTIYLDYGNGYELVTECDPKINFVKINENFIRQKTNISGIITFWGSAFTEIQTQISNDVLELSLKIEIDSIEQGEFYMQLTGTEDNNAKLYNCGSFTTNSVYERINTNINTEYIPFLYNLNDDLITRQQNEIYYNISPITTEPDPTTYRITTDPQGNATVIESVLWTYFIFDSTVVLGGGNFRHIYKTSVLPSPATSYALVFEIIVAIDNTVSSLQKEFRNIYMKASATVVNNDSILTNYFSTIDSLLSFYATNYFGLNATINCDYIDLNQLAIAELYRVLGNEEPDNKVKLSLADIFSFLRALELDWYVNGSNQLTFLHKSEYATAGTYDVSEKDVHNKINTYIPEERPKYEKISFGNEFLQDYDSSQAYIEYARSTTDLVTYGSAKFTTDLTGILRNSSKAENNGFLVAFLSAPYTSGDAIITTSTGIISDEPILNAELSSSYILENHFLDWRYAGKAEINGVETTLTKRPMYKHNDISLNYVLPSDIDLANSFTTSDGNYKGAEYEYDPITDAGILRLMK